MRHLLEWTSDALNRAAIAISVVGSLIMLGAILFQIVARYILFEPPAWTEELARLAMIWAGLAGTTVAYKRGSDPSLVEWRKFETPQARGISLSLRVLATVGFAACILVASPQFLSLHLPRVTESLQIPSVFAVAIVPLMALVLLVHAITKLVCGDEKEVEND